MEQAQNFERQIECTQSDRISFDQKLEVLDRAITLVVSTHDYGKPFGDVGEVYRTLWEALLKDPATVADRK